MRVLKKITMSFLSIGLFLWAFSMIAHADVALNESRFSCANVSEIPTIECEALVVLSQYVRDGDDTDWFENNAACSWEGIACNEGHITQIVTYYSFKFDFSEGVPAEIGDLSELVKLSLANNGITELPAEIGSLSKLVEFNLNANDLTELPPEIGDLSSLKFLRIASNRLTMLLPEISNLSNLVSLNASYNQLSTLPPEIGELSALNSLSLYGNQLTTLPPEIAELSALAHLGLSYNLFRSLPPEIGRLSNLYSLELSRNQLTELPPEIGELSALRVLELIDNQLSSLPEELLQLTSLRPPIIAHDDIPGFVADPDVCIDAAVSEVETWSEITGITSVSSCYAQEVTILYPDLGCEWIDDRFICEYVATNNTDEEILQAIMVTELEVSEPDITSEECGRLGEPIAAGETVTCTVVVEGRTYWNPSIAFMPPLFQEYPEITVGETYMLEVDSFDLISPTGSVLFTTAEGEPYATVFFPTDGADCGECDYASVVIPASDMPGVFFHEASTEDGIPGVFFRVGPPVPLDEYGSWEIEFTTFDPTTLFVAATVYGEGQYLEDGEVVTANTIDSLEFIVVNSVESVSLSVESEQCEQVQGRTVCEYVATNETGGTVEGATIFSETGYEVTYEVCDGLILVAPDETVTCYVVVEGDTTWSPRYETSFTASPSGDLITFTVKAIDVLAPSYTLQLRGDDLIGTLLTLRPDGTAFIYPSEVYGIVEVKLDPTDRYTAHFVIQAPPNAEGVWRTGMRLDGYGSVIQNGNLVNIHDDRINLLGSAELTSAPTRTSEIVRAFDYADWYEIAAETLNIPITDLTTSDDSVRKIARENGVRPADVIRTITQAEKAELLRLVESGSLSRDVYRAKRSEVRGIVRTFVRTAPAELPTTAVETQLETWASWEITSHSYLYQNNCLTCYAPVDYTITVDGGVQTNVAAVPVDPADIPNIFEEGYNFSPNPDPEQMVIPIVDPLGGWEGVDFYKIMYELRGIEERLQPYEMLTQYDPILGYPTSVYIDYAEQVSGGELGYTFSLLP